MHASAGCSSVSRTEGLDVTKLPVNIRGDYDVFAHRCSKCHSLARPLNAGITDDQQWINYVNRMRLQPGSGISIDDQDQILTFLHYYAGEIRRKDAEKHGLAPPVSSTSTSPEPAPTPTPAPAPPPPPTPSPTTTTAPVPASHNAPTSQGAG